MKLGDEGGLVGNWLLSRGAEGISIYNEEKERWVSHCRK